MRRLNKYTTFVSISAIVIHIASYLAFEAFSFECMYTMVLSLVLSVVTILMGSRYKFRFHRELILVVFAGYLPTIFIDPAKVIFWMDTAIMMTPAIIIILCQNLYFMIPVFLMNLLNTNLVLNPLLIQQILSIPRDELE